MEPLKHSIIGENLDKGFIEALLPWNGSSLRVCIGISAKDDQPACLEIADARLPALIADMCRVEEKATEAVESDVRSTVFDVWIETDGITSYTCGFLYGELEGELVVVA